MRRLLVNADDFGLTPGVNRAIQECSERGIVTSTTLMANGSAFDDAVRVAKGSPKLDIGCHIVLVDGPPLLPAPQVPSLLVHKTSVEMNRTLSTFARKILLGRIAPGEITAEATAQFQKLKAAGIAISHFDTHKHTHIFPRVLRPLLEAAHNCGIRRLRNPFVPARPVSMQLMRTHPSLWKRDAQTRVLRWFASSFHKTIREFGMAAPDGCFGIVATGSLDENLFEHIAATIPEGTWELVCHPGYNDDDLGRVRTRLRESRVKELQVLTSPAARAALERRGIELISFHDLAV